MAQQALSLLINQLQAFMRSEMLMYVISEALSSFFLSFLNIFLIGTMQSSGAKSCDMHLI